MLSGMVPHPLKLVVIGYGAAVCVAAGILASGGGWIAAALGFWLSGPVFVLAIGATPPLSRAFQRREDPLERLWEEDAASALPEDAAAAGRWLPAAGPGGTDPAESLRWDRDLAEERSGADLAAWDRDRVAERSAADAEDRGGRDRPGAGGPGQGARLPDRLGGATASAGVAGTGTG